MKNIDFLKHVSEVLPTVWLSKMKVHAYAGTNLSAKYVVDHLEIESQTAK